MNYTLVDYLILLIFFVNILLGFARGLLRELVSMISILVALWVAIKWTVPLSDFLNTSAGFQDVVSVTLKFTHLNAAGPLYLIAFAVSFLLLFVGVYSMGEAANYYASTSGLLVLFPIIALFDKTLAAAAGFVRGYIFSLVFILIFSMTPLIATSAWSSSVLVHELAANAANLANLVKPGGFPVWS